MNRRGFLGSVLAAAVAPAICKASTLMPVRALSLSPGGILCLAGQSFDFFSGLTIEPFVRESVGYDINRDVAVRRLDLLVAQATGHHTQHHVSFAVPRGEAYDHARHMAPAMHMLRERCRALGVTQDQLRAFPANPPRGVIIKLPLFA